MLPKLTSPESHVASLPSRTSAQRSHHLVITVSHQQGVCVTFSDTVSQPAAAPWRGFGGVTRQQDSGPGPPRAAPRPPKSRASAKSMRNCPRAALMGKTCPRGT